MILGSVSEYRNKIERKRLRENTDKSFSVLRSGKFVIDYGHIPETEFEFPTIIVHDGNVNRQTPLTTTDSHTIRARTQGRWVDLKAMQSASLLEIFITAIGRQRGSNRI